ncbi:MAG: adenine nucleotide alpha hydrolase family protein [Clostridia bacterium]|nr:adenine nucleotide alpha hydrolase family protein [Clostridia bacterium]
MQKLLSFIRRGVDDYKMINENDHITVGVSGGKDSLALLVGLANLRRFYPKSFKLSAVTLDMGFGMDFSPVEKLCDELGVEYVLKKTDIAEILFDIRKETNPCSLCAKMRRGALHDAALELGSHKVALGHHNDDALDTFMLSLVYEGRVNCFSPVTYLDRKDITLIRPMIYAPENFVIGFAKKYELPIVKNRCPEDKRTKREYAKNLIKQLEKENPGFKTRLFTAIEGSHAGNFGIFPE